MRDRLLYRARFLPLLFFAAVLSPAVSPLQAKPAKPSKILDLNDTVMANRILTKFAAIIQGSNLATFLSSRGPFTLFAPTDSAFSKLPPGTLESLLQPQNQEVLQRILLFHLVNGKRLSGKDLLPLKTLLSCEGTALTVHTTKSGAQLVMKAKILHADIRCANGLIHEIDTVLIPADIKFPLPPPPPVPAAPPATNAAPEASADGTNAVQPPVAAVATPD